MAIVAVGAFWMLSCNGGGGAGNGGAGFGAAGGVGAAAGPGICGTTAKALSTSCTKDASGNIEIGANGCGPNVYVDQNFIGKDAFNTITIDSGATLCFPDRNAQMDVGQILDLGTLQIGQKAHPIGTDSASTQVIFNFTGGKTSPGASNSNCVDPSAPGQPFSKGIEVCKGGKLQMYGLRGVPPNGLNWTYLDQPAGPPDKYGKGSGTAQPVGMDGNLVLHLADDVGSGTGAWRAMDWIAVGSTSFSPFETEIVQIFNVVSKPPDNPNGSDVYIMQPLTRYHFGSAAPEAAATYPSLASYNDGADKNYGVDERAPVALISRSIKLTATIAPGADNLHWGGELKFLQGFAEVSIQGVELQKFGKDHIGSYPIHFHRDGDLSKAPYTVPPLIDSDSIDHSYNKCVTVHSTQNLTVSNIVCVRAVGHLFYEEIGDESNVTFMHNLGMGAMSNSFDINKTDKFSRADLIQKYWWTGDYMTNDPASKNYIGYDGFNVPDMDATTNPVHGSCAQINGAGQLYGYAAPQAPPKPACPAGQYYIEPASGFWITNPSTRLIGNIVDGCQGVGVGYWYVTAGVQPADSPYKQVNDNQFLPVGTFRNNRVSACFDGLFGENAYSLSSAALLHPHVGGLPGGQNLLANFDGLTATRNRDRGVWMRDQWFVINNGRFATNRDSASLLTAGGADGATPGDWMLVDNSVFEGESRNNVDRFGPCALPDTTFSGQQVLQGCVALTPAGAAPHSGDEIGKGYPDPNWNEAGYMIYDGPAKLYNDRFVDFNADIKPELTTDDNNALANWTAKHSLTDENGKTVPWVYEGDAALGWFQSNQSSYPTLTNSAKLSFVNTDLRHQIYTQLVNLGKDPLNPLSGFGDGDKNTAVIDLDGTLSGYQALDSANDPVTKFDDPHPISLNNLMINASSNSVDECESTGGQDAVLEKRPTSLMSPSSMASLELQMLYPPTQVVSPAPPPPFLQKQNITFTKDSVDFGAHQSMTLSSRNALGVWEPKVTSGLGYTVTASIDTADKGTLAGIPKVVDVGLLDAYKSHISPTNPFYIRVGICYTSANGSHPASGSSFTIVRGYHSYGGGTLGSPDDLELRKYYNKLDKLYTKNGVSEVCDNLDGVNFDAATRQTKNISCPADGISLLSQGCPTGMTATDNRGQMVCVYPPQKLTEVPMPMSGNRSLGELTNPDGTPAGLQPDGTYASLNQYYYDPNTGWLFFYVAQQDPNSVGPSPLGSCGASANPKDPSCPNTANEESYYVCPAQGCTDYVVTLNDSSYMPSDGKCPDPYSSGKFGLTNGATVPEPVQPYRLVKRGTTTTVVRQEAGAGTDFPHYEPTPKPPMCE